MRYALKIHQEWSDEEGYSFLPSVLFFHNKSEAVEELRKLSTQFVIDREWAAEIVGCYNKFDEYDESVLIKNVNVMVKTGKFSVISNEDCYSIELIRLAECKSISFKPKL